ncbi:MAG: Ku protein, partial [Polyangia bacterium]
ELEALDPKATRTIDIEDFVALDEIDPIYYQHSYYLVPDRGGAKPYALLLETMKRLGKVAIARVVLRTKQYLCALRPMDKALMLSTMLYADEVVAPSVLEGLPAPSTKPRERELQMAEQLVRSLVTDFDPKKYHDDYRERVLELVARKSEGEEIVSTAEKPEPARVIDLMQALKESLKASGKEPTPHAAPKRRAPAHRPRARRAHRKTA